MRRLPVAIVLITLIFLQLGGVWMMYTTAIVIHRQQKALRLGDVSKRVELILDASTYATCLIEEDEICFKGMHYDVLSVSCSTDFVRVVAVPDPAENKLHRTLTNLRHQSTGWSRLAHLASVFSQSIYIPSSLVELELPREGAERLLTFPPISSTLNRSYFPELAHPPCCCV